MVVGFTILALILIGIWLLNKWDTQWRYKGEAKRAILIEGNLGSKGYIVKATDEQLDELSKLEEQYAAKAAKDPMEGFKYDEKPR
jgi:hypothetical protein